MMDYGFKYDIAFHIVFILSCVTQLEGYLTTYFFFFTMWPCRTILSNIGFVIHTQNVSNWFKYHPNSLCPETKGLRARAISLQKKTWWTCSINRVLNGIVNKGGVSNTGLEEIFMTMKEERHLYMTKFALSCIPVVLQFVHAGFLDVLKVFLAH